MSTHGGSTTLRDAQNDLVQRERPLAAKAKIQVPCLPIQEEEKLRRLYNSNAVIVYLEQRFTGIG